MSSFPVTSWDSLQPLGNSSKQKSQILHFFSIHSLDSRWTLRPFCHKNLQKNGSRIRRVAYLAPVCSCVVRGARSSSGPPRSRSPAPGQTEAGTPASERSPPAGPAATRRPSFSRNVLRQILCALNYFMHSQHGRTAQSIENGEIPESVDKTVGRIERKHV